MINNIFLLVEILKKLEWKQIGETERFIKLKPPASLKFSEDYFLYIPISPSPIDSEELFEKLKSIIANIYGVFPINISLICDSYNSKWTKEEILKKLNDILKVKYYYNDMGVFGEIHNILTSYSKKEKHFAEYFIFIIIPDTEQEKIIKIGKQIKFGNEVVDFFDKEPYLLGFDYAFKHSKYDINYIFQKEAQNENYSELKKVYKIDDLKEEEPSKIIFLISRHMEIRDYIMKKSQSSDLKLLVERISKESMIFEEITL
ncbi:MAG: hypothetical protein H7A23_01400 [Leptospiraceae bacterium]|nr:hypothetical protein [Nanoarchaeota archaeon]MCP5493188.1 hypothetical protein [Leptospiraceae bacterium]